MKVIKYRVGMASIKTKLSPYYALGSCKKGTKLILPSNVRFVQRDIRLRPFHSIFLNIARNARRVCKQAEGRRSVNVLKLLDEIIPLQYFGANSHRKLFYRIVKLILTRSEYECVFVRHLIKGFDLKKVPWLTAILDKRQCQRYLFEGHRWLLEKIVKPLINRVYVPVRKGQRYEIKLVPRHIWMSFQNKVINQLQKLGHLIPISDLGIISRGVLQIRPKNGYFDSGEFRPILRLKTDRRLAKKNKEIIKMLTTVAETMCSTKTASLYHCWKEYVTATRGEKIYGVKLDVRDAFGNTKIDVLCNILEKLQILPHIKTRLIYRIRNQYVSFGKKNDKRKIWQWKHGLLQGDTFSSILCQLFMSHKDVTFLSKFYKPHNLLHRTVDDYFFCSTNEANVEEFIAIMSNIHILNMAKTESNLPQYGNHKIAYCGQIFDMDTKQVKSLYNFKKETEIRHRFRFWNIDRPIYFKQGEKSVEEFLERPMLFKTNSFRFKNCELNTFFNNEPQILQNYFESMMFLAFKFDAAVMAVNCSIKQFELVSVFVKRTVFTYAQLSLKKVLQNRGQYYAGSLSLSVFLKVGVQAFILVLKKRMIYQKFEVIEYLAKYMKKIYIKNYSDFDFRKFKKIPQCFSNICISRRLPHQKNYELH